MKIYQVDSFTDKIFKGNPAGVCILRGAADEQWMQDVAMEMNLSETAFLYRQGDGFNLRWFTPETEVDLCGHATLASAHILWETGVLQTHDEAVFFTKSGRLSAKKDQDYIILDFPAEEDVEAELPEDLGKSLGVKVKYAGRNRMDYIVEVESEEIVRSLKPDFEIMKRIGVRGVIVTSRSSNPEYDFVSRFFAPGVGVNEDPVTGSAHCCLGPYWEKRLVKDEFTAYQASKRGGILKVVAHGDRVFVGGKAVTVFCAELKGGC
jgi:PhzF family phenazine biosynthesis protein